MSVPSAIVWEDEQLKLLDQRALPTRVTYLNITDIDDAWLAINSLAVRGAPAIGIAAAYALAVSMRDVADSGFLRALTANARRLKSARPTAVNLAWALDRLCRSAGSTPDYHTLVAEAEAIHLEDRRLCRAIGEAGRGLINAGCRVMTHCNAGALAVSELGTATAPLYLSHSAGVPFRVYANETRPLLQGARITAWELDQAGIDVTILCDNAAASLMASGQIDLVIVGTDRVTANGDVVNKIGTLNLAVLCRYFDIPFYVACPASTFDAGTATGSEVIIEQRDPAEVIGPHTAQVAVHNPAFDVTPVDLVTGLVTNLGLITNPANSDLKDIFGRGTGIGPS